MAVGNLELIKSGSGTSVNTLSITDCFTSSYSVYQIQYYMKNASNSTNLDIRLLDSSNTEITTTTHILAGLDLNMAASFTEVRRTGDTAWLNIGAMASDNEKGLGGTMRVFNPFDSSSFTFALVQFSGWNTTTTGRGRKNLYSENTAQQVKGVKFFINANTGYTMDIEAYVYGIK